MGKNNSVGNSQVGRQLMINFVLWSALCIDYTSFWTKS